MNTENNEKVIKFIYYFIKMRNVREAAIHAGFNNDTAFCDGMKLLNKKLMHQKINYFNNTADVAEITAGLERLAFGCANDAVRLAFCEELPEPHQLDKLDLFNVSEIKRVKGGGVEIKLFDRQKALEKIWEIQNSTDLSSSADSFFNAIQKGADALMNTEQDDS